MLALVFPTGASISHTDRLERPSRDPEVTVVLERELKLPGDVTTILEERDCFEVFRLIAITEESWKVEAVRFPKLEFDSWLESQIRKIPRPTR